MTIDKIKVQLADKLGLIVLLIAIFIGTYGIFDRYLFFHDEIINTYKAHIGLIFDYALRPVFYSFNVIGYKMFGHSPNSLILLSFFCYLIITTIIFAISDRVYGKFAGLLSALVFIFSVIIFHIGIRAMPHMLAGLFSVLSLSFLFIKNQSVTIKKNYFYFLSGIFSVISLATHPTMLAYLFALNSLFFFQSIREFIVSKKIIKNCYVWGLFGSFISFVILSVVWFFTYQNHYISGFFSFTNRIWDVQYDRYFQPWFFYINSLYANEKISLLLLIALMLFSCYYAYLFFRRNKFRAILDDIKPVLLVLYVTICSFFLISLATWKFDRVLVSFMPLLSVCIGFLGGFIARVHRLLKYKYVNWVMSSVIIFVIVFAGSYEISTKVNFYRNNSDHFRHKYFSLYSSLSNIADTKIGFIGSEKLPRNKNFITRYFTLSDKEMIDFGYIESYINNNEKIKILKTQMTNNSISYFVTPSIHKIKLSLEEYKQWQLITKELSAVPVFNWRNIITIWKTDCFTNDIEDEFLFYIKSIGKEKIAIYGTKNEISIGLYNKLQFIRQKYNLRFYPLTALKRTSETNFYYINRNAVRYILLSKNATKLININNIDLMREYMIKQGANLITSSDALNLELWKLVS